MQTTAIRTVASSLPQNEVILLTLLISKGYIPYTDLYKIFGTGLGFQKKQTHYSERNRSQRGISFKQHYVNDYE